MSEIQQLITRLDEHGLSSRVGKKSFRIEVLKFVIEKYAVRSAVLQIFVGDEGGENKEVNLNRNTVSGSCGGIHFQFEITSPPNCQKTINANFWTAKD